nr:PREDICTED: uncharacterized protein LOC106703006 [Latimeria chalumnae]|eukprot:XP_014342368.1 PREDICTED: uncharacterized protein LOC106703006 [Latimeria chalumnae]
MEQLDNRTRPANLRIIGMPENGIPQDLAEFLAEWIPKALKLEEGLPLSFILKAYKIPPAKKKPGNSSVTIIVRLVSENIRDLILLKARKLKSELYQEKMIFFYPDLCTETVNKRKKLVEFRQQCSNLNFKSSLLYPEKLQVRMDENVYVFWEPLDVEKFLVGEKKDPPPSRR